MSMKIHQMKEPLIGTIPAELSPGETASYTREMLDSLRGMALRQDQLVLAGLLEAAAREAKRLVANSFD